MNKRVLLLDHKHGDGGGAGRYLLNLAQLLLEAGCQVDVAFLQASDDRCLRTELQEEGATVYDILEDDIQPDDVARWLNDFLESSDIDALHVNWGGPEMRECLVAWDVDQAWRGHRLYTLHLPLESPASLASWTLRDRLPFSWKRKKRKRLSEFFNRFDRIISVSKYNAVESQRLYRLPADKIQFIPNGVDVEHFRPRDNSMVEGVSPSVVIGACSRLAKQKRLDILIRAFAGLHQDTRAELRVAGAGEEEGKLRALSEELGVAARIHFVGFQRNVSEFLQGLDVFVLTSDREGLPYAVLEAMACGLPSVVTNVNDVPYVVRDGIDGFVIPTQDVVACRQRMLELVRQPHLRERMGANARKRACDQFSHASWQSQTWSVYEEFLDLTKEHVKTTEVRSNQGSRGE